MKRKKILTKKKKKLNGNNKILFNLIIMRSKPNAVKLNPETVEKIKKINLETGGVNLTTYDDKINHLIWLYEKYIKNNKDKL